jgi:uracil DNA glycosylase
VGKFMQNMSNVWRNIQKTPEIRLLKNITYKKFASKTRQKSFKYFKKIAQKLLLLNTRYSILDVQRAQYILTGKNRCKIRILSFFIANINRAVFLTVFYGKMSQREKKEIEQ